MDIKGDMRITLFNKVTNLKGIYNENNDICHVKLKKKKKVENRNITFMYC